MIDAGLLRRLAEIVQWLNQNGYKVTGVEVNHAYQAPGWRIEVGFEKVGEKVDARKSS